MLTRPPGIPAEVVARPATTPVTLEFHSASERALVIAAWKQLESDLAPVAVTCSANWIECWLNHYGDHVPHQFVIARRATAVCAILLLTEDVHDRRAWIPAITRRCGTAGELDRDSVCVEYNDWLCAPHEKEEVLTALLTSPDRRLSGDRWMLDGFAAIDLPDSVAPQSGWRCERKLARYCDLREVRASGRELITFFGDSTRKTIRQNLRDYVDAHVEWAETLRAAHAIFDELITLHQARWQSVGEPGCYASVRFTAFHRELIDRLFPAGQLAVVRVQAGGITLGCSQFLIDRHRVLVYQGGRVLNTGKHSPGLVTDYLSMLESLRRGYDAFDFMAGDSIHKQRLTTHTAPLVWAERRMPGWKLPAFDLFRSLKRTATALVTLRDTTTTAQPPSKKD